MSVIDLSQLPFPGVVETIDYEEIYARRKARLISLFPADQRAEVAATLELESEPLAVALQENVYEEIVLRQRVNDAARAVMLAYAKGADLDQLAANFKVKRLVITPEDTTTVPPTPAVMESDESLRERAQQAWEGLSVAGPRNAYIFHARSADGRVADATAISPAPCEVVVTVLGVDGDGSVGDDVLAKVRAKVNDEDIRPVGDRVTEQSAKIVNYAIDATLYLSSSGPEAEPIMAAAAARAEAYRKAQRRLGRDINRSAIMAALHVEGVTRVDLHSPAVDIELDETQAGHCTGVTIVNGGVRD
ncbi:baseplate J/gp47 family protein [Cupriavidus sp. UGS-1]|uniref:baseplate J/gp47 family protein n=1 Tax=Cupriavidus sp. UGS-1 TaxID=2899826 RepID=UPI001E384AB7|nr:baseplate J/gp47 family protein [Cupriavidus sp. UGS-1]MCD9124036.1 baseplate J/gp47 family protein [Cupriavidus sp. UGS-1]